MKLKKRQPRNSADLDEFANPVNDIELVHGWQLAVGSWQLTVDGWQLAVD